jgi:hypothetical protein
VYSGRLGVWQEEAGSPFFPLVTCESCMTPSCTATHFLIAIRIRVKRLFVLKQIEANPDLTHEICWFCIFYMCHLFASFATKYLLGFPSNYSL